MLYKKTIQTIFSALCILSLVTQLSAQAPNLISYQAEIRNSSNALVTNATVAIRFSILQTTATGTAVYVERHTPTTNANGLASVSIGAGTVVSGVFANINWASGPYYLKTEIDPAGGTAYSITGTQQMLSVPYALYSNKAANGVPNGTAVGQTLYWNGSTWVTLTAPTTQGNVLTFCDGTLKWTANGVCPGTITALNCSTAANGGVLVSGTAASSVTSSVPYTGGNGGPHSGQTVSSTGVTGLTATLAAGSFANGSGNLIYNITGTPSSFGTASFALNIGGKTCTLTRPVSGKITGLGCATAIKVGSLIAGVAASGASCNVAYTGGDGGPYYAQSVASSGVTGLTASLASGTFAVGNGNLVYTITGTPSAAGTASFALSIGGQACTLTRTVNALPTISTTAASLITTLSAVSGGSITSDGGYPVTARGVCWSTAANPTTALTTKTSDGTGTGTFTSNISGLSPGTTYYVRAYATTSVGTAYGAQVSFTTVAATVTDVSGYVYNTVTIGTQVWMKENLLTFKYRNGDPIPGSLTPATWSSTTSGAYAYYNDLATSAASIGALYNWYTVADARGLCPTGWHVPSQAEFNTLSTNLGGTTVAGGKLKSTSTTDWGAPNTGATNSSGFTAKGAGYRNSTGTYAGGATEGRWWTSTSTLDFGPWYMSLRYDNAVSNQTEINDYRLGNSVRCLKD